MKKVIRCLLITLLSWVLGACKSRLAPDAYVGYVRNTKNGLVRNISIANWDYSFQFKPVDYMMLMENKGEVNKDSKKRRESLKGTAWFNISFKRSDGTVSPLRYDLGSREEYDSRYNYFLNQAVHTIRLLYNNTDTLRPIAYLFENNFNLTPQETMIVGFQLPKGHDNPENDMQLSYDDQVYKNGIIKVKFKSEDLRSIPNLIY